MTNTCPECGNPGTLSAHPDCKRKRNARAERERKAALKKQGFSASDLSYRPHQARKIGVTVATFDTLGSNPCDICGAMPTEARKHNSPYVRRDTGAVVGTICQRCATGLGFFGHDPARLRVAIALMTSENDLRDRT